MKPSFFTLFKRGRYYHPPAAEAETGTSASDEDTHKMEERERFIVAAMAFCLRHDERFRRHFWNAICGQSANDAELHKDSLIEIEQEHSSDLKITTPNCIVVVEFKAGAKLKPIQNPKEHGAFFGEDGYGRAIQKWIAPEKRDKRCLHYTILGHSKELGLGDGQDVGGIVCAERSWSDLINDYERSPLVEDLFTTLGNLGIKEFRFMNAKKIHVSKAMSADAANAWSVIDAVKNAFGFKGEFECSVDPDNCFWSFGSQIREISDKNKSAEGGKTLWMLAGAGNLFGWFGYEHSETGAVRCVLVYFKGESEAQKFRDKIKDKIPTAFQLEIESGWEGVERVMRISQPIELSVATGDFVWFANLFNSLELHEI